MGSYVEEALVDNEEIVYVGAYALWDNFWWIVLTLGLALPIIFYWQKFSEIAITNYRVISKKGIIQRSVSEYPIKKIETVNVNQSICGRIFNYGHIIITGTGNNILYVKNVKNPEGFKRKLNSVILAL